jgi:hypothetical protein
MLFACWKYQFDEDDCFLFDHEINLGCLLYYYAAFSMQLKGKDIMAQ